MPGGDRTGPAGAGPMTGRGVGYCSGYGVPGFVNPTMPGQIFGFGFRGGGRGWRNMAFATRLVGWQRSELLPINPEAEVESLKRQAKWLKDQLISIDKRLEELGGK